MLKVLISRLAYILVALVIVIAVGTFSFSHLEGLSLFNAFYFTVVTVATVGYGDITPTTTASKILAMIIILVGVGAFTGLVVNATQFLVEQRTEKLRRARLNMLVELFFSEIGNEMLRLFSAADPGFDKMRTDLKVDPGNPAESLNHFAKALGSHSAVISADRLKLQPLNDLLGTKENLLIRLLENPNLNESEASTELLRATFHLRQELKARPDLSALPRSDLEHLANDSKRAYVVACKQWIENIRYLNQYYPYLFSLSVRSNPFTERLSPYM
jgi:voltage-gated potassium channel